jgi:uncharacterized membrane protein YuzA (DUF378 family)
MKTIHMITLVLLVVGGINWGLVGAFGFNLVTLFFGEGTLLTTVTYILVGLSALYHVKPMLLSGDTA